MVTQTIEVEVAEGETKQIPPILMQTDALGVNEVIVLGTRREGRTVLESSVPIDIITAKEVEATGYTQTVEVLQSLIPSVNSQKNSITDATDYIRPAQLRGLGAEHVLVLVNGKRRHISSVVHDNEQSRGSVNVDLNSIPPSSIERIEVLRDGAAAQYGSDAIAGVINIVLKKNTDLQVSFNYGQNFSHEKRGYGAGEGLNGMNTDETLMSDPYYLNWVDTTYNKWHYDGQSIVASIAKGVNIGKGTLHGSFQFWKQGKSSRNGLDPKYQYFAYNGNDTIMPDGSDTITYDPREATINRENWWYGKSEMIDYSGFVNFDMPFSSSIGLYAFGGVSRRNGSGPCFWREPLSKNTVRAIHPNGYLPNVRPKMLDLSGAVGIKGLLGTVHYDISQTVGHNDFNFTGHTLNVSLGDYTSISDPELQARTFFEGGGTKFMQWTTNADFSTMFDVGLASDLHVAAGAEFRNESYEIYAGEPAAYTNGEIPVLDGPQQGATAVVGTQCVQSFHALDQVDATRSNWAIYGDFEVDLLQPLTIGAALRYENYSDFGANFNYKFSGRWAVTNKLAIRAAVSTGFRAPGLPQMYYSNRSLQTDDKTGELAQTGTFPVESEMAKAVGAKPLEAEKSTSFSGGITIKESNLSVSIDAYRVYVDDRILLSEKFKGRDSASAAQFTAYLDAVAPNDDYKGIQQINYFINGLNTVTDGLDIVLRYLATINENNALRFTYAAGFTRTRLRNESSLDTPEELKPFTDQKLLEHTNLNNIQYATPNTIMNFIINYNYKNFNAMWKGIYYGSLTASERFAGNNPDNDQFYDGQLIHNVEINNTFLNGALVAAIGANNLLDTYPEKRYKAQAFYGRLPYSGYVPYGFTGRYVYIRLGYTLK